jgi:hypothetical protein
MPTSESHPVEAATAGEALAYYRAVKQAGQGAPVGQFLNTAERVALDQGREFMRNTLQTLTQEQIDEIEKKKR